MAILVGVRDLKNRLGRYLQSVRDGTRIIVTDRGQPVAELHAIGSPASKLDERIQRMALEGLVTLPTLEHLPSQAPRQIAQVTLSDAVIEDRQDRL